MNPVPRSGASEFSVWGPNPFDLEITEVGFLANIVYYLKCWAKANTLGDVNLPNGI